MLNQVMRNGFEYTFFSKRSFSKNDESTHSTTTQHRKKRPRDHSLDRVNLSGGVMLVRVQYGAWGRPKRPSSSSSLSTRMPKQSDSQLSLPPACSPPLFLSLCAIACAADNRHNRGGAPIGLGLFWLKIFSGGGGRA